MKREDVKEAPQVFQVGDVVELVEDYGMYKRGNRGFVFKVIPEFKEEQTLVKCSMFKGDSISAFSYRLRLVTPAESAKQGEKNMGIDIFERPLVAQNTFSHIFDLRGAALPTLCVEDGKIYPSRQEALEHCPKPAPKVSPLSEPLNTFMDTWCRP